MWLYEMPEHPFTLLDATAGYYLADETVTPIGRREVADVPRELLAMDYELRVMPSLWPLRDAGVSP